MQMASANTKLRMIAQAAGALSHGLRTGAPDLEPIRLELAQLLRDAMPTAAGQCERICGGVDRLDSAGAQAMAGEAWRVQLAAMQLIDQRSRDRSHSPDFSSVRWGGMVYDFPSGMQRVSVRMLWESWEAGGLAVAQATIGEAAGSASDRFRLSDAFRNHPAWGRLIVPAGRGLFRLADPHDEAADEENTNAEDTPLARTCATIGLVDM